MTDIKLRDIMDVTEKIKNGIEDKIQEISIAERILPSEPILKSGPMYGRITSSRGNIDSKDMCLSDICDRIVSKASLGLSEEIDKHFMHIVRNRTIGRFTARETMANLYLELARKGEISYESAKKLESYTNTIPYVGALEREGEEVRLDNYVALTQALAERDIPAGSFLVNSFIAAKTLTFASATFHVSQNAPLPHDLIVHNSSIIIPRENEIVGDEIYLFAERQYLGEAQRGELWLQIGISPHGISWDASISYDFEIKANAVAVSVLKKTKT